jgi:hypothetical protein
MTWSGLSPTATQVDNTVRAVAARNTHAFGTPTPPGVVGARPSSLSRAARFGPSCTTPHPIVHPIERTTS